MLNTKAVSAASGKNMIAMIPNDIDLSQGYLADYWSERLGITRMGLECAIAEVGTSAKKVEKYLDDGYRIAIRDSDGVERQVLRIAKQRDGFSAMVPYHPAKQGWLYELPLDYSRRLFAVPISEGRHFTVSDAAKLSFHMDGFVQFSTGSGRKIISGYNPLLNQVKGVGIRAPTPVNVTSGPLFGIQVYKVEDFQKREAKSVVLFEEGDLWCRVGETTDNDIAYHVEFFMLPGQLLAESMMVGGRRVLRKRLPYNSQIWFTHDLRVLEFQGLPFFLGAIVSRIPGDPELESGYKLNGPSCEEPGSAKKKSIAAQYPCPDRVSELNPVSLDYIAPVNEVAHPCA